MRRLIFALVFLVQSYFGYAQIKNSANYTFCSTSFAENPIPENYTKFKRQNNSNIYHIPVVFHVFRSVDPEGQFPLSKAEEVIEMLNKDFNAQNENLGTVQSQFQSIIGDIGFEFHLAKIDNTGKATNGITYTKEFVAGDNPGSNSTLKKKKNWNSGSDWSGKQKYLQIWVTTNVNGESNGSGWAYLPNSDGGGKMAGVVYNLKYLGDGSDYMHRVLTHEIGHYFGLSHTFGPSYDECGDDGIEDTPITRCYSHECRTGQDLCGDGIINVENFMDYTSCTCMFTNDQKDLMHYWIEHDYRNTLWSEENLKVTGVWSEITGNDIIKTKEDQVKIFPNPTNGIIIVEGLNNFNGMAARIYTVNGSLIKEIKTSGNQIDLSDLNNGMYIIELKNDELLISRQIQISK